ncbi:endonuclease V-like [Anguilla anguilla]|uniref:endonuclease V-like n=1 Tax=Anguilla anguilla TaxID=7936 RepID=UPI0015B0491C|nr:endonuclease V-like [Anguilla anguilla]
MSAVPPQNLIDEWTSVQASLKQQLVEGDTEEWQRAPDFKGLERVGGVDLSFIKGDDINACAQLVVLSFPELELLYEDCRMVTLSAPYVAGYLAFRETPCLLEALQRLERTQPGLMPQVLFVDGNGVFHYREFGVACHLGVLSGLPCVGVAKNLLQVQGVVRSEEHLTQVRGHAAHLNSTSGHGFESHHTQVSDSRSSHWYLSVHQYT